MTPLVMDARPRAILTIAGTDPVGASGIQVDLQVFRDFGLHGTSVATSILWQNTVDVRGFKALDAATVSAQIDAVLSDVTVDGVKIGLVPTESVACAIAESVGHLEIPIVVDPVFASGGSGVSLTSDSPLDIAEVLLPMATVVTPNAPEAKVLWGDDFTLEECPKVADEIRIRFGSDAVVLKVGHMVPMGPMSDALATATGARWTRPLHRVQDDVRGTGCQLSSAIAAGLSRGERIPGAVENARTYLNQILNKQRHTMGKGRKIIVRTEPGCVRG